MPVFKDYFSMFNFYGLPQFLRANKQQTNKQNPNNNNLTPVNEYQIDIWKFNLLSFYMEFNKLVILFSFSLSLGKWYLVTQGDANQVHQTFVYNLQTVILPTFCSQIKCQVMVGRSLPITCCEGAAQKRPILRICQQFHCHFLALIAHSCRITLLRELELSSISLLFFLNLIFPFGPSAGIQ